MPKLKSTLFLPLCQFVLSITLFTWGHNVRYPVRLDTIYLPTVTLICYGINAPILLIRPLISLLTSIQIGHGPRSILGFALDEILFLVAVLGLWSLVARWFQTVRDQNEDRSSRTVFGSRVWNIVVAMFGAFLLVAGILLLLPPDRFNNPLGTKVEAILIIAWASALLFVAGRSLLSPWRRKRLASSLGVGDGVGDRRDVF